MSVKADVVLAGVGGQGVLLAAGILAEAARRSGLCVKQSELHGMSQRGGAVQAMVRIGSDPVESDLVARGAGDLVLGLEPLEALRSVGYLAPHGVVVTSADPHRNIPDYPPAHEVLAAVRAITGSVLVDAARLAREAGSARTVNVVMIGAAVQWLPVTAAVVEGCIADLMRARGERMLAANLAAFRLGCEAAAAVTA